MLLSGILTEQTKTQIISADDFLSPDSYIFP